MSWIYKRPDSGIWQYGWRENDGDRYASLKTRKKSEAVAKQLAEDAARARGETTLKPAKKPTHALNETVSNKTQWDAFWKEYAKHLELHFKPSTFSARKWAWDHATRAFSPFDLSDCTPERVEAYKASWKAAGKNPVTFNDLIVNMHAIYGWATPKYFNEPNPWAIRPFPQQKKRKTVIDVTDYDYLIQCAVDHSKSQHNGGGHMVDEGIPLVFVLGLYFGFRKAEIAACHWEWFNWETGKLTLFNEDGFSTKSGNNRTIPIFEAALKWLMQFRKKSGYVYRPEITEIAEGAKYRTDFKKSFASVWKAAQAKREKERETDKTIEPIPNMTTHLMRHSFITNALKAGADVYEVADWVGHSSIYILETYRHAIPAKDSARKLFRSAPTARAPSPNNANDDPENIHAANRN